jgi:hypothetical protein
MRLLVPLPVAEDPALLGSQEAKRGRFATAPSGSALQGSKPTQFAICECSILFFAIL